MYNIEPTELSLNSHVVYILNYFSYVHLAYKLLSYQL